MPKLPDVDLSDQSMKEVRHSLGQMSEMAMRKTRAAIFLVRGDGVVTVVDSALLQRIEPHDLAEFLLESWEEEHIEEFLQHIETLGQRSGS